MPKTALIIGDSISNGYAPLVEKQLAARPGVGTDRLVRIVHHYRRRPLAH